MFWVGTASAVAGGLVLALILWLISLAWKRFSQRKLTKAERLKAQLKQHRWELRHLGEVALRQIVYFILHTLVLGLIVAWLFTSALGEFLSLVEDAVTLSIENVSQLSRFLLGIPTIFVVWSLVLMAGPLRRILLLLAFDDWQERHLTNRIKQLEPDWKDIDF